MLHEEVATCAARQVFPKQEQGLKFKVSGFRASRCRVEGLWGHGFRV